MIPNPSAPPAATIWHRPSSGEIVAGGFPRAATLTRKVGAVQVAVVKRGTVALLRGRSRARSCACRCTGAVPGRGGTVAS